MNEAKDRDALYGELAQQAKNLEMYRRFLTAAEERRDEAIAEEAQNIEHESKRINAAEDRIRELVTELGLS